MQLNYYLKERMDIFTNLLSITNCVEYVGKVDLSMFKKGSNKRKKNSKIFKTKREYLLQIISTESPK
jgi:hypothetical protein